jgi:hypothetical protein
MELVNQPDRTVKEFLPSIVLPNGHGRRHDCSGPVHGRVADSALCLLYVNVFLKMSSHTLMHLIQQIQVRQHSQWPSAKPHEFTNRKAFTASNRRANDINV